jgi:Zn-dependent membrane protease YugP
MAEQLYFCPFSRFYFRRPPCNPRLSMHKDVYVGDVLAAADIADHELGHDLALERYELYLALDQATS